MIAPLAKFRAKRELLAQPQRGGRNKLLAVSPFDMTNKGKCVKVLEPHCRAGRGKQMAPHHMPVIPIKIHSNSFLFSSASLFHTSEQACLTTEWEFLVHRTGFLSLCPCIYLRLLLQTLVVHSKGSPVSPSHTDRHCALCQGLWEKANWEAADRV